MTDTTYKGLHIVPKLDFGSKAFLIDGHFTKHGYIVTDGLCNVMPGAIWFQTVAEAKLGIDIYHLTITGKSVKFYEVWHKIEIAQKNAAAEVLNRESTLRQAELMSV